jgi:hypothetical protein
VKPIASMASGISPVSMVVMVVAKTKEKLNEQDE